MHILHARMHLTSVKFDFDTVYVVEKGAKQRPLTPIE